MGEDENILAAARAAKKVVPAKMLESETKGSQDADGPAPDELPSMESLFGEEDEPPGEPSGAGGPVQIRPEGEPPEGISERPKQVRAKTIPDMVSKKEYDEHYAHTSAVPKLVQSLCGREVQGRWPFHQDIIESGK